MAERDQGIGSGWVYDRGGEERVQDRRIRAQSIRCELIWQDDPHIVRHPPAPESPIRIRLLQVPRSPFRSTWTRLHQQTQQCRQINITSIGQNSGWAPFNREYDLTESEWSPANPERTDIDSHTSLLVATTTDWTRNRKAARILQQSVSLSRGDRSGHPSTDQHRKRRTIDERRAYAVAFRALNYLTQLNSCMWIWSVFRISYWKIILSFNRLISWLRFTSVLSVSLCATMK